MTLRTTTSPTTSPAKREIEPPPQKTSREFKELEEMIDKANDLSKAHFQGERNAATLESSSKKVKVSVSHVERAALPNPLFSLSPTPAVGIPRPVFLPTPEFKVPFGVVPSSSTSSTPGSIRPTPPPIPRKKTPQGQESPFERQYQQTSKGSFTFQNLTYLIREFGRGSFSTVYTLTENQSPLFANIDNSQLVIKVYNGIRMRGFNQGAMSGYLASALENYTQVTRLSLPVATIHNSATALSDLAIIQEKVDADVDLNSPAQMGQVKHFFALSIQNGVLMDLQPGNLKVKNGTVVLIDFIEELADHNISTMINLALKAWVQLFKDSGLTREQAETHLHQLTEGFETNNPSFNAKWRQDLLNG